MEEKKRLEKLKEYEKIGTLKEFKELYKIKTTDYIHRGEGVTERDYYYYTNGAQAVLDEVEQLKKENKELKSQVNKFMNADEIPASIVKLAEKHQNKLAIKQLEELINNFSCDEFKDNGHIEHIKNIIAELKGEKE